MSYDTEEVVGGEPVELFKFVYGTDEWFWTSGVEVITKDGDLYLPIAIRSGNISADGEAQTNSVEITVLANNEVAQLFTKNQPGRIIKIDIFRKQRADPEFSTVFRGEVATASFGDTNAILNCAPSLSIVQRKLAVLKYQPTCNNRLGDTRCQVNMVPFTYTYTVTAITEYDSESNLEMGGDALTFFSGDHESWLAGGTAAFGNQILMIMGHIGNNVALLGAFDDIDIGDTVTVKAGCDKLVVTCRDKFDNLPRFQGFPYSPPINPAIGVGVPVNDGGFFSPALPP